MGTNQVTRIALVESKKCRPKKCKLECRKCCPVNKVGKKCITVTELMKMSEISETLCIGCGACVRQCPFGAIKIVNLPTNLEGATTHRYGPNAFKLHRLPIPRAGQVLGLVGTNGIGKSTALKILGGHKPNLGRFATPPSWDDVLRYFRGSELQGYFTKLLEESIRTVTKPQFVEQVGRLPQLAEKTVGAALTENDERGHRDAVVSALSLGGLLGRRVCELSGGELQRFVIAITCCKQADVYMFDEPSSYLDIKQRLEAARCIRALAEPQDGTLGRSAYVVAVEHDLCILDYLSDFSCLLYGVPGVYGVVTFPYSIREGINHFLAGKIPTDNMRFREEALSFETSLGAQNDGTGRQRHHQYPHLQKQYPGFSLEIEAGEFSEAEIIVLVGENGMGKTTFMQMLAGLDQGIGEAGPSGVAVSYKPQKMSAQSSKSVRSLFEERIGGLFHHGQFQSDVVRPLQIEPLLDSSLSSLSGGELQRVAITLCLGKPAQLYLLDEPSAYLDAEQRVIVSKVLRRFIINSKRTAFVVEHDFAMATYLADRVIVYSGEPGVQARAHNPVDVFSGMNSFLQSIEVTFRRDKESNRPRINKLGSVKDREQKQSGEYFKVR